MNNSLLLVLVAALVSQTAPPSTPTFRDGGPGPGRSGTGGTIPSSITQIVLCVDTVDRAPADDKAAKEIDSLRVSLAKAADDKERERIDAQIERILNKGKFTLTGTAAVLAPGDGRWNDPSPHPQYGDDMTVVIPAGHGQKATRLKEGEFILVPNSKTPSAYNVIQKPVWWMEPTKTSSSARQTVPPRNPALQHIAASGSGFFVSEDGYFVTNHHVVDGAGRITITTQKGTFRAAVICDNERDDLAVLKVEGKFEALPVHGSDDLKVAQKVFTVGYPQPDVQGFAAKYTDGTVTSLSGMNDDPSKLQISVPVQPGNSGGPLVDSTGRVVGVIVSGLHSLRPEEVVPQNVNYAIKGTILRNLLEAIPDWDKRRKVEAAPTAVDQSAVAAEVERATGLVLIAQ